MPSALRSTSISRKGICWQSLLSASGAVELGVLVRASGRINTIAFGGIVVVVQQLLLLGQRTQVRSLSRVFTRFQDRVNGNGCLRGVLKNEVCVAAVEIQLVGGAVLFAEPAGAAPTFDELSSAVPPAPLGSDQGRSGWA